MHIILLFLSLVLTDNSYKGLRWMMECSWESERAEWEEWRNLIPHKSCLCLIHSQKQHLTTTKGTTITRFNCIVIVYVVVLFIDLHLNLYVSYTLPADWVYRLFYLQRIQLEMSPQPVCNLFLFM